MHHYHLHHHHHLRQWWCCYQILEAGPETAAAADDDHDDPRYSQTRIFELRSGNVIGGRRRVELMACYLQAWQAWLVRSGRRFARGLKRGYPLFPPPP